MNETNPTFSKATHSLYRFSDRARIVMGNLAGYRGNRLLAEFAQRYGAEIARVLQVELEAMPSFG